MTSTTLKSIAASIAIVAALASPMRATNLVILHTNDTHSQIDPSPDDGLGGIHRRKVVADSVRAANPGHTILVDAGDIVQGTLFFNIYKGELEEKLMNALGYDIRILGNHEFDNGMEDLARNLSVADAQLLAANYQTQGTPLQGLFQPYTIKEIDGKRIGFIPVNLEPAGMISPRNYQGMGYVDAIEAANNMAWYLKNIMQTDAVIAVTHIGYQPATPPGDIMLAQSSRDIDVIIGGHSHTLIDPDDPNGRQYLFKNADGRDVLVAQTGKGGKYVGQITIDLDNLEAVPAYRLIRVDSRLDDRLDPAIEQIIEPYRSEVDRLNSLKVTRTARFLDKGSDDLLNFASDFVAARGRQMAEGIDFAILNKGGLRNSLPKGDITEGQIITLMPFFNRILVLDILGSDLAEAFDVMATVGGNGVSSEVEATYDPVTRKCMSITVKGRPLDPDKTYRIATIDYLAQGGDYMTPLTRHSLVAESPQYLFEDMLDYLRTGRVKVINPSPKKRMRPITN